MNFDILIFAIMPELKKNCTQYQKLYVYFLAQAKNIQEFLPTYCVVCRFQLLYLLNKLLPIVAMVVSTYPIYIK